MSEQNNLEKVLTYVSKNWGDKIIAVLFSTQFSEYKALEMRKVREEITKKCLIKILEGINDIKARALNVREQVIFRKLQELGYEVKPRFKATKVTESFNDITVMPEDPLDWYEVVKRQKSKGVK